MNANSARRRRVGTSPLPSWTAAWCALVPAVLLLGGCLTGPDYRKPPLSKTQAFPEAFTPGGLPASTNLWKRAEPAAHLPRGTWWEVFQDQELNRLEALATAANQELAAAAARYEQARATVR